MSVFICRQSEYIDTSHLSHTVNRQVFVPRGTACTGWPCNRIPLLWSAAITFTDPWRTIVSFYYCHNDLACVDCWHYKNVKVVSHAGRKKNFLESLSSLKIKSMTATLHIEKQLVNNGKQKQNRKFLHQTIIFNKTLKRHFKYWSLLYSSFEMAHAFSGCLDIKFLNMHSCRFYYLWSKWHYNKQKRQLYNHKFKSENIGNSSAHSQL